MERPNTFGAYAATGRLAVQMHRGMQDPDIWNAFNRELQCAFGHTLFTVLAYDDAKARMRRVYSSRPDINPVGGAKAVTDSFWTGHVLREGRIYVGSDKGDIAKVFSDHALLALNGCDSVLNLPVRKGGRTIGTLNLLHRAGHYDAVDQPVALVFAQMAVDALASQQQVAAGDGDECLLESV